MSGQWRDERWLVIDTETTGLDDAKIIELGAVVKQGGEVIAHRSSVFDPGKPIDEGATAAHGITDDMVRGRPRITDPNPITGRTPAQGLDRFVAEHDARVIVGYNALGFDLPIMRRELGHTWDQIEACCLVVDPLVVVRMDGCGRYWKGQGRHKLVNVAERFGLTAPVEGMRSTAHRAVWDAVLAGRVLWRLRKHLPESAIECAAIMRTESAKQQANFDAWKASQSRVA